MFCLETSFAPQQLTMVFRLLVPLCPFGNGVWLEASRRTRSRGSTFPFSLDRTNAHSVGHRGSRSGNLFGYLDAGPKGRRGDSRRLGSVDPPLYLARAQFRRISPARKSHRLPRQVRATHACWSNTETPCHIGSRSVAAESVMRKARRWPAAAARRFWGWL